MSRKDIAWDGWTGECVFRQPLQVRKVTGVWYIHKSQYFLFRKNDNCALLHIYL
jgi:hypothetical protein